MKYETLWQTVKEAMEKILTDELLDTMKQD